MFFACRPRPRYTQEAFIELTDRARATVPGLTLSTDVIAGFCGETEEEHEQTLHVMRRVRFEQACLVFRALVHIMVQVMVQARLL